MKNIFVGLIITFILSGSVLISGCVSFPNSVADVLGIGLEDLESAKATGIKKVVDLPKADTFNAIVKLLLDEKITVYQQNLDKGYIVAMNFPKQTNTTRVGIFFEPLDQTKTQIIICSKSSTALQKADKMIQTGLDKIQIAK